MHSVATHCKRRVNDQRNGRPLGLSDLSFTSNPNKPTSLKPTFCPQLISYPIYRLQVTQTSPQASSQHLPTTHKLPKPTHQ
jgi:hypothetical protein